MNKTKNDLSFNEAKLDLEAMRTTARVAVGMLVESISNRCATIRDNPASYLEAGWLENNAKLLTICSETLATLNGAIKDREIITFVR